MRCNRHYLGASGRSVRAIELGYIQREIEEAAYRYQVALEDHRRIVVGVIQASASAVDAP